MAGSRPQSHGDAISMENSLELYYCCTFLPTATTTETTTAAAATTTAKQQINQQPQQYYINENQNFIFDIFAILLLSRSL